MEEWSDGGGIQRPNTPTLQQPVFCLSLHLHFAAGAGNTDLLRPRLAGGLPIHRALHDVAHLGEPPACAGDAPFPTRHVRLRADAVETEFQLVICRVCHIEPFFARHSARGGWTLAVQGKIYLGIGKHRTLNLKNARVLVKNLARSFIRWRFNVLAGVTITSHLVNLLSRPQTGLLFPSEDEKRPAIIGVFV